VKDFGRIGASQFDFFSGLDFRPGPEEKGSFSLHRPGRDTWRILWNREISLAVLFRQGLVAGARQPIALFNSATKTSKLNFCAMSIFPAELPASILLLQTARSFSLSLHFPQRTK
jgi:hypothetical protein